MAMASDAELAAFDALGDWEDYRAPPVRDDDGVDPNSVDPRLPSAALTALEAQVAALEAELAALRVQKLHLLAADALITRLPPELLARIFELGVHDDLHLLPALHAVSRYWRRVALATPALSSYLRLDGTWGYGRAAAFLAHAQMFLARAHAAKLLVDLDFRYVDALAELNMIMAALAPHLARCFSFRVSVPDWEWLAAVRTHAAPALGPALEELSLRIDPSDAEDQSFVPFLSPHTLYPRLRTVRLEHTPLLCIRAAPLPALARLTLSRDTRYHSSTRMGVPLAALLRTLSSAPALSELRVHGVQFHLEAADAAFLPSPTLTPANALRVLAFTHVAPADIAVFLACAALPALRTLALHMEPADEATLQFLASVPADGGLYGDGAGSAGGLTARLPALRALDLRSVNIDGAALFPAVRALRALPRLEALSVAAPPSGTLGARFFDLLTWPCAPVPAPHTSAPHSGDDDGDSDADDEDAGARGRDAPDADANMTAEAPPELLQERGHGNQHAQPAIWLLPALRALCVQNCRDVSGHELVRVLRARRAAAAAFPPPPAVSSSAGGASMLLSAPVTPGAFSYTALADDGARAGTGPGPAGAGWTGDDGRVARVRYVRVNQCYAVEEDMVDALRGLVDVFRFG